MEKVEESLSPALVGAIPELVKTVRKYIDNRWFKITSLSKSVQDIQAAKSERLYIIHGLSDEDIEQATLDCLVRNKEFWHEKESLVTHVLNEICDKGKTVSLISDSEKKLLKKQVEKLVKKTREIIDKRTFQVKTQGSNASEEFIDEDDVTQFLWSVSDQTIKDFALDTIEDFGDEVSSHSTKWLISLVEDLLQTMTSQNTASPIIESEKRNQRSISLVGVVPELVKTVRKYIDNRWFKITCLSKSIQDIQAAEANLFEIIHCLSDKDIEQATLACLVKHETFWHEKELFVTHVLNEISGEGKTVSLISDSEKKLLEKRVEKLIKKTREIIDKRAFEVVIQGTNASEELIEVTSSSCISVNIHEDDVTQFLWSVSDQTIKDFAHYALDFEDEVSSHSTKWLVENLLCKMASQSTTCHTIFLQRFFHSTATDSIINQDYESIVGLRIKLNKLH